MLFKNGNVTVESSALLKKKKKKKKKSPYMLMLFVIVLIIPCVFQFMILLPSYLVQFRF